MLKRLMKSTPLALLSTFLLFFTQLAQAGDFATRQILGFSADGSHFAFEEYGVQDGSGFPYSNIYVIDTATDEWIPGSPYRARIDDENATISDARQQARTQAGTALDPLTFPGVIAATNQPLEVPDNPHRMVARPRHFVPPTSERIEFRIEEISLQGQDFCADFGETKGFRLSQIYIEPGKATRLLHEDGAIPTSRGCPLVYRFADIVTFHPESGIPVAAILILVEQVGFEGPDGRYLAVTTRLE